MTTRRDFLTAAAVTAASLAGCAGHPRRSALRGWRDRKRVLTVHGARMAYVATEPPHRPSGETAPAVVFLHGNPTSSYLWRNILPGIEPHAWGVAPDLIGMGDSDKLVPRAPADENRYRFETHRRFLDGFLAAVSGTRPIILVLHDWGGMLGFDWARRHAARVRGIAHMETVMDGLDTSLAPAAAVEFFRRYRTAEGERMVLRENQFVEQVLIGSLGNALTEADRAEYRRPFIEPGEGRRPTLTWPRQVPIDGDPAEVAAIVRAARDWLAATPIPKLFLNGEPGALVASPGRKAICRSWPNTTEVTIPGRHFLPEEAPEAIRVALVDWIGALS